MIDCALPTQDLVVLEPWLIVSLDLQLFVSDCLWLRIKELLGFQGVAKLIAGHVLICRACVIILVFKLLLSLLALVVNTVELFVSLIEVRAL